PLPPAGRSVHSDKLMRAARAARILRSAAHAAQTWTEERRMGERLLSRSSRHRLATLLMILSIPAVPRAWAQSAGANVGGIVTDPSGARLPGVTVTVTNRSNGATQTFVTGPEGNYRAVALQPGPYTISAELQGFMAQTRAVTLTVGADSVI